MLCALRLLRLERNLLGMRRIHLPILASVAALGAALLYSASFVIFGRMPVQELPRAVSTMTFGDFTGILAVYLAVYAILLMTDIARGTV